MFRFYVWAIFCMECEKNRMRSSMKKIVFNNNELRNRTLIDGSVLNQG